MNAPIPHTTARRAESGFTLVEMMVAMGIMLVVIGSVFSLVDPSRGISKTQPEVSDMQERMRVAADMLQKDLLMAGAGTYSGSIAGALANYFPPILPYRAGAVSPDPEFSFFEDRITIAYVPSTASQTNVRDTMPSTSAEVKVNAQPGCPEVIPADNLCGFKEGMRVLIFDDTGTYDFFTITQVQSTGTEGHLQHNETLNASKNLSKAYSATEHAQIAMVENHVYWLDHPGAQLHHYDFLEDLAAVDNTVGLRFRYFGDPNPPLAPRPKAGQANCIFDAGGNPTMPTLDAGGSSLVELTAAMLTDRTPACGMAPNQFDGDLYRIRKVRVELRVQAGLRELRGTNPSGQTLFVNPGNSGGGYTRAPDYLMEFEVAPRNMNLVR
jgi:prepilin-type N-terminal cleavage/methylation domain-containing protein